MPGRDLLGDPGVLVLLRERRVGDLFGQRGRDDDHAVAVADDDVARLHGRAAASDRHVEIPRHVLAAEHRGVRARRVDRDADRGDRVVVADAAVGDDAGRAAGLRAQREDVAERAGAGLAARLDHDDLALADGVERALLRVVAAAVRREEVFAAGDEAQGLRGADELGAGVHRPHAVDRDVVQPALAQLRREPATGTRSELVAQLGGERVGPDECGSGRRARSSAGSSAPAGARDARQAGGLARAPRLGALRVVDGGERARARVEGCRRPASPS